MANETKLESEKPADVTKPPVQGENNDTKPQGTGDNNGRDKSESEAANSEKTSTLLSQEAWTSDKQRKPFAATQDKPSADALEQWRKLTNSSDGEDSPLRKMNSYIKSINTLIVQGNSLRATPIDQIDATRFEKVSSTIEAYERNEKALVLARELNDQTKLPLLLKEQETLRTKIESKEFRQDFEKATKDFELGYNTLRSVQGGLFNSMLSTMVDQGMKIPLERLPLDVPRGVNGLAVSDAEFRSMVSRGEIKLNDKQLAPNEMPKQSDFQEMEKMLRFNGAANDALNRRALEQQYAQTIDTLNAVDSTGEKAKKWFPKPVEELTDKELQSALVSAAPWLQKIREVQRIAEMHDRFRKMVGDQFNWPKFLGGMPAKWDASGIENHPDLVAVNKMPNGKTSIKVEIPDSLERNDSNTTKMRELDEWLTKYRKPVDQALDAIKGSGADNAIIFWGDIKTDMMVDRDGAPLEKGLKDKNGKYVFQESDGRKFRYSDAGKKELVPADEKLTEDNFRMVDGKPVWLKADEPVTHINLMEFRTKAEVVVENGETFIEIQQNSKLQYATWLSYNGWGLVNDMKTMGGDVKAHKITTDTVLANETGVVGGRRQGKAGEYLVTLPDGRKQFIDQESFEKSYREKKGSPGEYEERPTRHKPEAWLIVYKTDGGSPEPTLMQAKDVPAFCASQKKWHWGGKLVTTVVDGLMLASGAAEFKAAMMGVQAASGAARVSLGMAVGKALLTKQGLTGALHFGFGATGFAGQGIENLGPAGKTFMHGRAIAMLADLSFSAIGRPGQGVGFIPTVQQINNSSFMTRSLLNFNAAYSGKPLASFIGMDKGAGILRTVSAGQVQALAADVYFMSEIGVRQIPGLWNHYNGTDSQKVQQKQALERRFPQSTLADDKKIPSSFDKQTVLKVEAFRSGTEEAMRLSANDPKRVAFSKKLIDTVNDDKADRQDRLGAAFALVNLYSKDGKLPEKISADSAHLEREQLQKFVDSQRYLQAESVIKGYAEGMGVHASAELKPKLDQLAVTAKQAMADNVAERNAAVKSLVDTFQSKESSAEEKIMAASSLLMARRHDKNGELAASIAGTAKEVKASELVDFLHKSSMAKFNTSDSTSNPGHVRLFAGDMMMRLDVDRFSVMDMNQICLSIVNDKNEPSDPAQKERWLQLKMQAMTDAHGHRLGDLQELMRSRVEPEIANMPTGDQKASEARSIAMAALAGRDSTAIKSALENLRNNSDPRIAALSSFLLYAASASSPIERSKTLASLHSPGNQLSWTDGKAAGNEIAVAQKDWTAQYRKFLLEKTNSELPGMAGDEFERASSEKLSAINELLAGTRDIKANPDLHGKITLGLLSLVNSNNPAIAARANSELLTQLKNQQTVFSQLKDDQLTPALKSLKEQSFGDGGVVDTLRDSTMDLLQDSSQFSSYASRAEYLVKDLIALQNDLTARSAKLSETDRTVIEQQIAQLKITLASTQSGPAELKIALIKNVESLLSLKGGATVAGAGGKLELSKNAQQAFEAIRKLTETRADSPETVSPQLRAEAVKALASKAFVQTGAFGQQGNEATMSSANTTLTRALKNDPSPLVRLEALNSMAKIGTPDLAKLCFEQLKTEKHPEVTKRLREVEFANRVMDENARDYVEKFNKARIDLVQSTARSLSGAEAYIKNDPSLNSIDGQTLKEKAFKDLSSRYFEGFGGFMRFAWEGEKGVTNDSGKFLAKYAAEMRTHMNTLGARAQSDPQALKALVYIALSNGRPLLQDDRTWAVDKASEKLREISKKATPEQAKEIVWAAETLLLNQPMMSASGRQNVLDGFKDLIAKQGMAGLTNAQVGTILTVALQHELRNMPAPGAEDYKSREKLQLDLLATIEKYPSKESLPALAAMSADSKQTPRPSVEVIPAVREKARELFTKIANGDAKLENFAKIIDYQDSYERALQQIRENSIRKHNLDKFAGLDNWFAKSETYNLLDGAKLRAAQGQASKDAFPSFIPWLFTFNSTIEKNTTAAVEEVWRTRDRQFEGLAAQSKLEGAAGKDAREALASIILTQGQPFNEERRTWAMQQAASAIFTSIKEGQPGARDVIWAAQAALIEGQNIDRVTRSLLMSSILVAKDRGAIDQKEAAVTIAASLETEYRGMPSRADAQAYTDSVNNQKYAIDMLQLWSNNEALPVLQAIGEHHPEQSVRERARIAASIMKMNNRPRTR